MKREYTFEEIEDVPEDLDINATPYPSFNDRNDTAELLNQHLLSANEKNQSLIFHTGLFDKLVHYRFYYPSLNLSTSHQQLTDLFQLPTLINFIKDHPDYLLILSSDHGVSKSGNFHGTQHTGREKNIGYFLFYHPSFVGQKWREIDVVDVLPTLCKYLKGVDIPYHSVGVVQNSYHTREEAEGNSNYIKALKQNVVQLLGAVKYRG